MSWDLNAALLVTTLGAEKVRFLPFAKLELAATKLNVYADALPYQTAIPTAGLGAGLSEQLHALERGGRREPSHRDLHSSLSASPHKGQRLEGCVTVTCPQVPAGSPQPGSPPTAWAVRKDHPRTCHTGEDQGIAHFL